MQSKRCFFRGSSEKKTWELLGVFFWLGSEFCWVGVGGWAKAFVGLIFCFRDDDITPLVMNQAKTFPILLFQSRSMC